MARVGAGPTARRVFDVRDAAVDLVEAFVPFDRDAVFVVRVAAREPLERDDGAPRR
ncbi:MAG: hypothetical protein WDZ26_01600 [Nitriliruptoraceae bacterium]